MQNGERVFYTSENGDRWLLLSTEDDIVSVRHVPNSASGGDSKTYELGGFLIEERHTAQNQALRALISSLTRVTSTDRGASRTEPIGSDNGRQQDDNIDDLGRRLDGTSQDQPGVDIDVLSK